MSQPILSEEGALAQGAHIVGDTHTQLMADIQTLRGQMEAIGSTWQGAAKQAFDSLMRQWDADTTKVTNVLQRFEQDLTTTQKGFVSSDEAGSVSMSRVGSRLGSTR